MLNIKPVFLYTDILVYCLFLCLTYVAFYMYRDANLRIKLRSFIKYKRTKIACVVLAFYAGIALLDSIHFTNFISAENSDANVYSLLDKIVSPIGSEHETTYSAPLSLYSFVKENVNNDGVITREYPRLKYAGISTQTTQQQANVDIRDKILITSLICLLISSVLFFSYYYLKKIKCKSYDLKSYLLIAFAITSLVLLVSNIIVLAQNYHVLGTDKIGEDVLFQALKSVRTGIVIGSITTLVMLPFAIFLGAVAGYYGGIIDDIIQYIYTTLSSIPGVLLIAAAVLSLQVVMDSHPELFKTTIERADARLLALCFILGITSWTSLCRLIRAETMKIRMLDYIQAARALGVGSMQIIKRHVLPNVLHLIVIIVALDFSGLVLAEAVLSYVGVGVDPATYSWGNMINSARLELAREPAVWWSLIASFICMFVLVLFANIFADALRDAFDPRLSNE